MCSVGVLVPIHLKAWLLVFERSRKNRRASIRFELQLASLGAWAKGLLRGAQHLIASDACVQSQLRSIGFLAWMPSSRTNCDQLRKEGSSLEIR